MSKIKKNLSQLPELADPPFAKQLMAEMRNKKVMMGPAPINSDPEATFIGKIEQVDSKYFVKLFNKGLKEFFDLAKSDMRVLSYIMHITPMKADRIRFVPLECEEFTGITSRSTVIRSLVTLANKNFIAKSTTPNIYWINPNIFFRGDRLVLVKEYRKIDSIPTQPTQEYRDISAIQAASPLNVVIPKALSMYNQE